MQQQVDDIIISLLKNMLLCRKAITGFNSLTYGTFSFNEPTGFQMGKLRCTLHLGVASTYKEQQNNNNNAPRPVLNATSAALAGAASALLIVVAVTLHLVKARHQGIDRSTHHSVTFLPHEKF